MALVLNLSELARATGRPEEYVLQHFHMADGKKWPLAECIRMARTSEYVSDRMIWYGRLAAHLIKRE